MNSNDFTDYNSTSSMNSKDFTNYTSTNSTDSMNSNDFTDYNSTSSMNSNDFTNYTSTNLTDSMNSYETLPENWDDKAWFLAFTYALEERNDFEFISHYTSKVILKLSLSFISNLMDIGFIYFIGCACVIID